MSAKKTHIVDRDKWDWSLSNCKLARLHGMSPEAIRKTRIKFGLATFIKEKQPKVYSEGGHLPGISLKEVDESERTSGKWRKRFWSYVKVGYPDECWLWIGGTHTQAGYGLLMVGAVGKTRR